jgi:hypothetical protein
MNYGKKGGTGKSPDAVAAELREKRRGYMASADGRPRSDNPFPDFTAIGKAWDEGYNTHQNGGALPGGGEDTGTAEPPAVPPPPPPAPSPEPAPRVSTSAPPRVATPAPPPVSTPSSRPTVRVRPEVAPYPRCPGCRTPGGSTCSNTCSHRNAREKAAKERLEGEARVPEMFEEGPAASVVAEVKGGAWEARPEAPPPPVEEPAPVAKVLPLLRVLPGGEAAPDPQKEHRQFLVELLEETLALVKAGHIDGGFFVVHHSPTHPGGCAWATAFSGNVDFVHRLGALELAKADLLFRANEPGGERR